MSNPTVGQEVLLRLSSGARRHSATIVQVLTGTTVDLVAKSDGTDPWDDQYSSNGFSVVAQVFTNVARGTGVGEWLEADVALPLQDAAESAAADVILAALDIAGDITTAIAAGADDAITAELGGGGAITTAIADAVDGLATTAATTAAIATAVTGLATTAAVTSAIATAVTDMADHDYVDEAIVDASEDLADYEYVDDAIATAIAGLPADDDSGYVVVAAAGTHPTRTINTNYRPNTSRPTKVTVSGTWSWTLSAAGTQAGVLELRSDTATTPTTKIVDALPSMTLTVGVVVIAGVIPWALSYDVPAGHYYRLAASGTGTFAVTSCNETAC